MGLICMHPGYSPVMCSPNTQAEGALLFMETSQAGKQHEGTSGKDYDAKVGCQVGDGKFEDQINNSGFLPIR